MDLFASRLNCPISKFASWKPDPDAVVIDAFSIPWSNEYYYIFPPFSLITRCVQKIINDQSELLLLRTFSPRCKHDVGCISRNSFTFVISPDSRHAIRRI
jgi:hypothetical protein